MNPRLALATIDHICDQILLQSWTWDPFISLSDYVIRPQTLTYLAILMLLPLFVAVGAEFKVLAPLVLPVLSGLTRATLLTLHAFLTAKVDLSG